MKRFACTLLALITAFSLCACDQDDDDRDRSSKKKQNAVEETTEETIPVAEPTDEEAEALEEYICAVSTLKTDAAQLSANPESYELRNIQELCQRVSEYAYATKWAKTDRAGSLLANYSGYEVPFDVNTDWDAEAVLAQFSVVKDVPLYRTEMTTDNLGNQSSPVERTSWHYNSNGLATLVTGEDNILLSLPDCIGLNFSEGIREYDKDGRLSKITTYDGDQIRMVCTYTYNENDQLINMTIRENTQTYEISDFRYDEQGRLSSIEWTLSAYDDPHALIYTYNADNTVAMVENITYVTNDNQERFPEFRNAMEYTYENGVAVSGIYTNQSYGKWYNFSVGVTSTWVGNETIDTYTFSYDNAGRLVEEVATHGNTKTYNADGKMTNESAPYYASTTYTTVYGDYYAQPAK